MKQLAVWPSISRLILSAVSKLGASASGSDIVTDNWLSFGIKVKVNQYHQLQLLLKIHLH